MSLLEKFRSYCQNNKLIKKEDRVLLGVSGGPDSLAMLDLFSRIQDEFNLQLYVFHLNHMFREEAAQEAAFVAETCKKYKIEAFIRKIDVPALIRNEGLSPEEAARKARFQFMEEKSDELDVKKIALGHNRDDQVETVLLHLCRGSALKGLTGINPLTYYKDKFIIHPLLDISSYKIEEYCKKRGLEPCRDTSNEKTIYTRNKIRHKVIPYIEGEINPGFKDVIIRMAGILREEEDFLEQIAAQKMQEAIIHKKSNKIILSVKYLRELAVVIRRRVIQNIINKLCGEVTDLYYEHLSNIDVFIREANTGKEICLPHGIRMRRVYNKLIIQKGEFENEKHNYNFKLKVPGEVNLPDNSKIKTKLMKKDAQWLQKAVKENTCLCDYDKIREPLFVRTRKPGDKIQPLGMKGIKKLKDFFIDEKVLPEKRDNIPLIVDDPGRIIWIAGMRMNDKFKVTDETENIIYFVLMSKKL